MIWSLGLRPFYLMASAFAALSVPLWALQASGLLPFAYLTMPAWHGHEMLAGYAAAVIAGFLLTAVRNWTGKPTPEGVPLAMLALLWLAARVSMLGPWPVVAAALNAAFPCAVAVAIAVPLVRARNRRNYFFVALLALMGAAILGVHLAMHGVIAQPAATGLQVGLDLVLFIIAVVGGRVIPMFTNNGVPGAGAARHPWVERLALGTTLALVMADLLGVRGAPLGVLAATAAVMHAVRLVLWRPWRTLSNPLVWILHAAYAWVPVHLGLRAAAAMGRVPESLALHALTIGVIGGMTLGMMTRTARGHTGLKLEAGRAEVAAYALVMAAAIVRVFGGMAFPDLYRGTLVVSAACWSGAFAIYFLRYWPILTRAPFSGRPAPASSNG